MNLEKLLSSIGSLWDTYAPMVIAHILLFLALRLWVVEPGYMLAPEFAWVKVKTGLDSLLAEAGIKIERGYALVGVIALYLVLCSRLVAIVGRIPLLRIVYRWPEPSVAQLVRTAEVLKLAPEIPRIRRALADMVEKVARDFKTSGETNPYAWRHRYRDKWQVYYGLTVLAGLVVACWLYFGANGARTLGHLVLLWVALACGAIGMRLRAIYLFRREMSDLRWQALSRFDSEAQKEHWRLRSYREKRIEQEVAWDRACSAHPGNFLRRHLGRLGMAPAVKRRLDLLGFPTSTHAEDWSLTRSWLSKFNDEDVPAPVKLRVDKFSKRFEALLECNGAGLFMLAAPGTALAPGAQGGGSHFSFASRSHGGFGLSVTLREQSYQEPRILWTTGSKTSELTDLGPLNIEGLVAGSVQTKSNNAPSEQELRIGHSYLLRAEEPSGTVSIIVFQCFAIEDRRDILVAWHFRDMQLSPHQPWVSDPWWRARSWCRTAISK